MMSNIKMILKKCIYKVCRLAPVKKKRILFFSYYGEHYSGSPKYISEYIVSQKRKDMEIVWAFVKPDNYKSLTGVKAVRYGSLGYYLMLATAKIIVTNYRMTEEFQKKNNQVYIQTWHSSLRLKMIEKDAEDTLPEHYVSMARKDSLQIDYLLAGCRKGKEIFEKAFWYNGEILETGTPQCDILFEKSDEIRKRVCQYFNVQDDTHFILYAPTFRKGNSLDAYNLDYKRIVDAVTEKEGGNWVLLLRLHPHLISLVCNLKYDNMILQATEYDEVQELLSVADMLISDYSAIMFDYAVTKKPCFLYVPDLEQYTSMDRKLYFDIAHLPFSNSKTNDELICQIKTFNRETYEQKVTVFLENVIGTYDDGKSCMRVLGKIQEIMGV